MNHDEIATISGRSRDIPWHVRGLEIVASLMMLAMVLTTFADVVGRYVFNAPIPGGYEYIGFELAFTIFAAFPLVTRDRGHITVSLLDRFYRGRVRWIQQLVVLIVGAAMIGFIAEQLLAQTAYLHGTGRVGDYLDVPLWPIVLVLAGLTLISFAYNLRAVWKFISSDQVKQ